MTAPTTPQAQVSEEMIERAVKAYTGLKELDDRQDTLLVKQSMRAALESALSTPPARDDVAALVEKAERWDALMSSRMHFMGSAGFNKDGTPKDAADYLHFGAEFWSKHPAQGTAEWSDQYTRKVLTQYVDHIRAAQSLARVRKEG